jgi:hypothetical protein
MSKKQATLVKRTVKDQRYLLNTNLLLQQASHWYDKRLLGSLDVLTHIELLINPNLSQKDLYKRYIQRKKQYQYIKYISSQNNRKKICSKLYIIASN